MRNKRITFRSGSCPIVMAWPDRAIRGCHAQSPCLLFVPPNMVRRCSALATMTIARSTLLRHVEQAYPALLLGREPKRRHEGINLTVRQILFRGAIELHSRSTRLSDWRGI